MKIEVNKPFKFKINPERYYSSADILYGIALTPERGLVWWDYKDMEVAARYQKTFQYSVKEMQNFFDTKYWLVIH